MPLQIRSDFAPRELRLFAAPSLPYNLITASLPYLVNSSEATQADAGGKGVARCEVSLRQLSYDDPGVDDAEFIELQLDVLEGSPERWSDCGLGELQLINGATPECVRYLAIPLKDLAVSSKTERVRICAETNSSPYCYSNMSFEPNLKNGWLQNGPDALAMIELSGKLVWSYSYGAPVCDGILLPTESGQALTSAGDVVDDVIFWCAARQKFVLAPFSQQRGEPESQICLSQPAVPRAVIDAGFAGAPSRVADAGVTTGPALHGRLRDSSVVAVSTPLFFDGGALRQVVRAVPSDPPPPSLGCELRPERVAAEGSLKRGLVLLIGGCLSGMLFLSRLAANRRRASR